MGCKSSCSSNCGCSGGCGGSCCGGSYGVSSPYYQGVDACPQSTVQVYECNVRTQAYKNYNAFSIPLCNASIAVTFGPITDPAIGSYLWNENVGYLKITGYDASSQTLTLLNPCIAACDGEPPTPGQVIPACTIWTLSPAPCADTSPSGTTPYPYLAVDFTAPANGNCVLISVTNVNGLVVNKNVAINTGVYRVSAINSATTITICNDGEGLPAGTPVVAKDGAGNYITPVVTIDANPCLSDPVLEGVPLVCSANTTLPLAGSENGQVLVWDSTSGTASFRTLGIPTLDCTELTACLTLDPALPSDTSYLVQVEDTSAYTVGEIVTINGEQFEVDTIDSATQMHITPLVAPVVVETFPAGTVLCSADCCSRIERIEAMVLDNDAFTCAGQWLDAQASTADAAAFAGATLSGGTTTATGNTATLAITNQSCLNKMEVLYVVTGLHRYAVTGADGVIQSTTRYLEVDEATGVLTAVKQMEEVHLNKAIPSGSATVNSHSLDTSYCGSLSIAAGATETLRARLTQTLDAGNATNIVVSTLGCRIAAVGVASIV